MVATAKQNRHQLKYKPLESKYVLSAGSDRIPAYVREFSNDTYILKLERDVVHYFGSDKGVPPINVNWMLADNPPPLKSVSIVFTKDGAKATGLPVNNNNQMDLILSEDPRVARFTVDIFKMVAFAASG